MGNFKQDVDQLRIWRDNNERKSREILDIWLNTVWLHIDKLGSEKYLVLEQVCIAALDCHQLNVAKRCIEALRSEFPTSLRVKRLDAMYYEAEEKYDSALEVLDEIIEADSTHSLARKLKVAIFKALGNTVDAIKELAEYLKIYMADAEAWQELSELYINEHDFSKAAFCVEELILHNPHNHLLHQRYAEIKYTQGGLENLELAKAYYAQALKLNPNNMRALYGLYLTASNLASSQKNSAQKKKEASKLMDWTLKEIKNRYAEADVVVTALAALEI